MSTDPLGMVHSHGSRAKTPHREWRNFVRSRKRNARCHPSWGVSRRAWTVTCRTFDPVRDPDRPWEDEGTLLGGTDRHRVFCCAGHTAVWMTKYHECGGKIHGQCQR